MDNQQRQQLKKYLDLVAYRWQLIALCLLLVMAAGLAFYLSRPKIYSASVLLSYEQQQINPARMAPEEQNRRLQDMVSTLGDIVTSRNNLESVITEFNLYPEARQTLPIEDVIQLMRKRIAIVPSQRGDTFKVSYEGVAAEKVMRVANALGAKFIEENLKYREERATETSKYTEDELTMAKVVMDEKDVAMRDYKLAHYNEMPDQRASNVERVNSLHEQHQNLQDSMQEQERTRVMVQEQLALRQRLAMAALSGDGSGGLASTAPNNQRGQQPVESAGQQLQRLQSYLDTLLSRYTEKHPEVQLTRQRIAKLQEDLTREGGTGFSGGIAMQDPEISQLQIQLKEIALSIESLKQEQKKVRSEIAKYEKWLAATPVREAEWATLTRDYNELRRHYDYLVAQNLQAGSAENLEKKQKGSKFKIIDHARFPEKPIKPDFKKVFLLAIGLGLALGLGITLGLDFADTSFRDTGEIENLLGVSVLATVPSLELDRESKKNRLKTILWIVLLGLSFLGLLLALGIFWLRGQIIL